MIDIWMIFTMTIPLLEIVGHSYSQCLKKELAKEENPKPSDIIDSLPRNLVSVHPKENPKPSDTIDSLPRNLVSVHPPALDKSKHSRRSEL